MQPSDAEQPTEAPARGRVGTRLRAGFFLYAVLLATAGAFLTWLPMIRHRYFDADEFEHSHAAWCVFKGMLPYRDFFEHHTPWYYYALQPLFRWFHVATSFESARGFLLTGRVLSLLLAILSVFVVVQLGRQWERRNLGLLAGLLLVCQPVFFQKAIEMRPDMPALPFFLGSLWLLLRQVARGPVPNRKAPRGFLGAGLGLGAAIMCTQKMLFVLPGLLAGLLIWSLFAERARQSRVVAASRMRVTLSFLLGICVPAALTWAFFALHHAGRAFITNNFLLNAKWKHIVTDGLERVVDTSWPILALGLVGALVFLWRFFRLRERSYGGLLLLCTMVGLFAGALVIPSAHGQYYLMPLPLVCLFAAKGLLFLVECAHRTARPALLVLALLALGVLPALSLRRCFDMPNDEQLSILRYVFQHTNPDDLVMDGWLGTGVFRPHAFHYFFLHQETVAMLPSAQLDAYLVALERRQIRPRLITMDRNLYSLGPRFMRFVKMNNIHRDGFFYFFPNGPRLPPMRGPLPGPRGFQPDRPGPI